MDRRSTTTLYAGLLIGVVGLIAWLSGEPFVFPSLGPSAFVLAFERPEERRRTRLFRIVGGHVIGVCGGIVAWTLLNGAAPVTATLSPGSLAGLRLAGGAVLSILLTCWGMIATDTVHPPACATTLIVSLGILTTPLQIAIIVVSVTALVGLHAIVAALLERLGDDAQPQIG